MAMASLRIWQREFGGAYYTLPASGFAARITTERIASVKISAVVFSIIVVSKLCSAAEPFGEFVELHSCDLYTGGCTASAESTLLGRQAFRAWSIERGVWNGQDLTTFEGRSSGGGLEKSRGKRCAR